jgi:hypothetical protein
VARLLVTLCARMGELDREDIYYAIKRVFLVMHPGQWLTAAEYGRIKRHYARLARRHYPYRTAARMLLRPLRRSPALQSATISFLAVAGWLLLP